MYLVDFLVILIALIQQYSKSLKQAFTQTYCHHEWINDSKSRFVGNSHYFNGAQPKAPSTRIRRFLRPQIFLCGYKNICVHTYPIRILTSQRSSQQSMRISKKVEPARLVLILWRQRIQKYTDTSVHTYPDTQRIQKFPLWRVHTEISGYTMRIRRTRMDARCIRIKKFADTKISGYVWTGPKCHLLRICESHRNKEGRYQWQRRCKFAKIYDH